MKFKDYNSYSFSSISNIPEFVLLPPQEEEKNEPCFLFVPDNEDVELWINYWLELNRLERERQLRNIAGLANPEKNSRISLFNSIIQLFGHLPAIHEELPLKTESVAVSLFLRVCHGLLRKDRYPDIDLYSPGHLNFIGRPVSDASKAIALSGKAKGPEESLPSPESLNNSPNYNISHGLDAVFESSGSGAIFGHDTNPIKPNSNSDFDSEAENNDLVNLWTHFQTFISNEYSHRPDSDTGVPDFESSFAMFMDKVLKQTRFGERFCISPPLFPEIPSAIPIDICALSNRDKIELLPALCYTFGLAQLFYGGPPPIKNPMPHPLLKALPHYLTIILRRKTGSNLNTTAFATDMLLDMKKFMDPAAKIPTVSHGYHGSPTMYRLHGFITQKEGSYMTFTRRQVDEKWYQLENEDVNEAQLGGGVIESRGVSCLIYRLQDI